METGGDAGARLLREGVVGFQGSGPFLLSPQSVQE